MGVTAQEDFCNYLNSGQGLGSKKEELRVKLAPWTVPNGIQGRDSARSQLA